MNCLCFVSLLYTLHVHQSRYGYENRRKCSLSIIVTSNYRPSLKLLSCCFLTFKMKMVNRGAGNMWSPPSCSISSNVSARPGGEINPISNTGPPMPMLRPPSLERQCTSFQIKGVSLGTAVIISYCVINFT